MLAGRMLFRDLVALFFESSQLEASTRKSYASHCRAHLRPAFGDRPVCEVDSAEVGRWMNAQQKAQVSVRTRVATRTTLSAILQFAVDNARLTHNPVRGTRGPRKTALHRRRPVLKPEQWPVLRREFNEYGPEMQLLIGAGAAAIVRMRPGRYRRPLLVCRLRCVTCRWRA